MAIPNQNVKKIDCKQGAVRAVRFNGEFKFVNDCLLIDFFFFFLNNLQLMEIIV